MEMRVDAARLVETVAVFATAADFEDAIDELMSSGFDRADLSFAAADKRVEEKLDTEQVAELEDNAAVPLSFYVAPESVHEAEAGLVGVPFYIGAVVAAGLVLSYIGGAVLAGTAAA
jgi:hypothetical protein